MFFLRYIVGITHFSEVPNVEKKAIKALEKELEQAKQQAAAERRTAARERQAKYRAKQLAAGKQRIAMWVMPSDIELLHRVTDLPHEYKTKLLQLLRANTPNHNNQAQQRISAKSSIEGQERHQLQDIGQQRTLA